jgi:hypothetical protein
MNLATDFILQVQEKAKFLNEEKKILILQIIDNFLPSDDWAEEYSDDEHNIALAEQELANGESASWNDITWKTAD